MITTRSGEPRYQVRLTNGEHEMISDAPVAKGGGGSGFGPHELLEAALSACIAMWIRMQADKLGVSVGPVEVEVKLHRDHPEEAHFEYSIRIGGPLAEDQRTTLLRLAAECPVKKTLSKKLSFRSKESA